MAESVNSKSVATSVEINSCSSFEFSNIIESLCDLCIASDTHVEANAFCEECEQLFCPSCRKLHQSSDSTGQHQIYIEQNQTKCKDQGVNPYDSNDSNNRKAVYIRQVDLSSDTDECVIEVSAIEPLVDGRVLICDSGNNTVKLFNKNYEILSGIKLQYSPFGVVALTSRIVYVNMPDVCCLQKLTINNKCELTLDGKRKTIFKCYRMINYKGDLIVYALDDFYYFIYIIDTYGKVIRCIYSEPKLDAGGFLHNVKSMTLSKDETTIYIVNEWIGMVGLSMTGSITFKYKEANETSHVGVCKDLGGVVYITCPDLNKVVMVTSNGEKLRDILSLDGMNPEFISYSRADSQLLIYSRSTQKLLCFKIKF